MVGKDTATKVNTYLGVDAGGTTTRSVLVDEAGNVLGRGSAGPANHRTASHSAAATAVRAAIRSACNGRPAVTAVGIGWSGLEAPGTSSDAREMVGSSVAADRFVLDSDVYAAHVGAFSGGPGLLISAGTGSMVLGVDSAGNRVRAGGWGYLYGDEGSATWIAREAIRAALKTTDGRASAQVLWTELVSFAGVQTEASAAPEVTAVTVTDWLYAPGRHMSEIAGFARNVYRLARLGDYAARRLLVQAGECLAELALAAHGRNHDHALLAVAGSGSVWLSNELVREACMRALEGTGVGFRFVEAELEPEMGAALMARLAG